SRADRNMRTRRSGYFADPAPLPMAEPDLLALPLPAGPDLFGPPAPAAGGAALPAAAGVALPAAGATLADPLPAVAGGVGAPGALETLVASLAIDPLASANTTVSMRSSA